VQLNLRSSIRLRDTVLSKANGQMCLEIYVTKLIIYSTCRCLWTSTDSSKWRKLGSGERSLGHKEFHATES